MKIIGNKPDSKNNSKANIMIATDLPNDTRVIQMLSRFLKHLNAGTLSVVMMVGLAVLEAVRGPNSAGAMSAADKTIMPAMATNVSSLALDTAIHGSGFHSLGQRTPLGPCPGLSGSSASLP